MVVGSRYLHSAGLAEGLSPVRKLGSQGATALGRRALGVEVTDPMSGFFMIRRELVEAVAPTLATAGFKVLFDILASQKTPLARYLEIASTSSAPRVAGDSKLDEEGVVVQEYLGLLIAKLSKDFISPRFIMFALVGASGVVIHLAILRSLLHFGFAWAQAQADRGLGRDDLELPDQQRRHLPRPSQARPGPAGRLLQVRPALQRCRSPPMWPSPRMVFRAWGPSWWVAEACRGAVVAAAVWNYISHVESRLVSTAAGRLERGGGTAAARGPWAS